jgi:hypothetical protein
MNSLLRTTEVDAGTRGRKRKNTTTDPPVKIQKTTIPTCISDIILAYIPPTTGYIGVTVNGKSSSGNEFSKPWVTNNCVYEEELDCARDLARGHIQGLYEKGLFEIEDDDEEESKDCPDWDAVRTGTDLPESVRVYAEIAPIIASAAPDDRSQMKMWYTLLGIQFDEDSYTCHEVIKVDLSRSGGRDTGRHVVIVTTAAGEGNPTVSLQVVEVGDGHEPAFATLANVLRRVMVIALELLEEFDIFTPADTTQVLGPATAHPNLVVQNLLAIAHLRSHPSPHMDKIVAIMDECSYASEGSMESTTTKLIKLAYKLSWQVAGDRYDYFHTDYEVTVYSDLLMYTDLYKP